MTVSGQFLMAVDSQEHSRGGITRDRLHHRHTIGLQDPVISGRQH